MHINVSVVELYAGHYGKLLLASNTTHNCFIDETFRA